MMARRSTQLRSPRRRRPPRARRGETITETLVAILICSVALLMLCTAVVGAVHMDASVSDDVTKASQQQEAAEGATGTYVKDDGSVASGVTGTVSIDGKDYGTVTLSGGSDYVAWRLDAD